MLIKFLSRFETHYNMVNCLNITQIILSRMSCNFEFEYLNLLEILSFTLYLFKGKKKVECFFLNHKIKVVFKIFFQKIHIVAKDFF